MKNLYCTIILIFLNSFCYGQDEIIKLGDSVALEYELKITKISADTLYFKAFRKNEFILMNKVLVYKYKDSGWKFIRETDKDKYLYRNGQFVKKYLAPEVILKQFEIDYVLFQRKRKCEDYKLIVTNIKGKARALTRERNLGFILITDSTSTFFILPLMKISSDSLFFKANFYGSKKYYGIPAVNFMSIVFETTAELFTKVLIGSSFSMRGLYVTDGVYTDMLKLKTGTTVFDDDLLKFKKIKLETVKWIIVASKTPK